MGISLRIRLRRSVTKVRVSSEAERERHADVTSKLHAMRILQWRGRDNTVSTARSLLSFSDQCAQIEYLKLQPKGRCLSLARLLKVVFPRRTIPYSDRDRSFQC